MPLRPSGASRPTRSGSPFRPRPPGRSRPDTKKVGTLPGPPDPCCPDPFFRRQSAAHEERPRFGAPRPRPTVEHTIEHRMKSAGLAPAPAPRPGCAIPVRKTPISDGAKQRPRNPRPPDLVDSANLALRIRSPRRSVLHLENLWHDESVALGRCPEFRPFEPPDQAGRTPRNVAARVGGFDGEEARHVGFNRIRERSISKFSKVFQKTDFTDFRTLQVSDPSSFPKVRTKG